MSPRHLVLWVLVAAAVTLPRAQPVTPLLLVVNKGDSALAIVDVASGRVTARVKTGDGPHEVVASSDGRYAFVSNYGWSGPGSSLSMIDVRAGKETRRVDLGALRQPHGLAVFGGHVYVTCEGSRRIARYDPASDRVDWQFETGQDVTHMVALDRSGARIFTSNIGSNTVSVIERRGEAWMQSLVRVGRGPEGFDLSPDGRELWAANSGDGRVSVVDLATRMVTQTIDVRTRRSNRLKFTPDGRLALISDLEGGELVILDAAMRREIKRLRLGSMPEGILIAPDGTRAYVAVSGDGYVAIVDLKTLAVVGRIQTGRGPDGMAWGQS